MRKKRMAVRQCKGRNPHFYCTADGTGVMVRGEDGKLHFIPLSASEIVHLCHEFREMLTSQATNIMGCPMCEK